MGGISCLLPCRYAYLQDFVVAAAWRNQGYGTALFQAAQAWARARGLAYCACRSFRRTRAPSASTAGRACTPT
jgi:GNAT superfamily N-acetyltransferase